MTRRHLCHLKGVTYKYPPKFVKKSGWPGWPCVTYVTYGLCNSISGGVLLWCVSYQQKGWSEIKLWLKSQSSQADYNSRIIPEQLKQKFLVIEFTNFCKVDLKESAFFLHCSTCMKNDKITRLDSYESIMTGLVFMLFNWIPLMAMIRLTLAITLVAIMVEMAILAILAIAIGVINMFILVIQFKTIKKMAEWC